MNVLPGIARLPVGGPGVLPPPAPFGVGGALISGLPSLTSAANPSLCLQRSPQRSPPDAPAAQVAPDEPLRVRFSSAADLLQPPPPKPPSRRPSALSQTTIHVTTPVDGVLTSL